MWEVGRVGRRRTQLAGCRGDEWVGWSVGAGDDPAPRETQAVRGAGVREEAKASPALPLCKARAL